MMAGKVFVGVEVAIEYAGRLKIVRINKSRYDHFAYRPDMGGLIGCFDEFNSIIWAVPLSVVRYIKNMEEGEW